MWHLLIPQFHVALAQQMHSVRLDACSVLLVRGTASQQHGEGSVGLVARRSCSTDLCPSNISPVNSKPSCHPNAQCMVCLALKQLQQIDLRGMQDRQTVFATAEDPTNTVD